MALERTTKRVSGDADGSVDIRDVPGEYKVTTKCGKVVLDVTGSKGGWDADAHIEMKPGTAMNLSLALLEAAAKA